MFYGFVIASGTSLRYKEIESDIRISEELYNELYKGSTDGRKLGSVGSGEIMGYWRNNYTNGQFIIPVTLLEDDEEEGTNSLTTQSANEIFEILQEMAEKLGNIIKFVRYDGVEPKPDYYVRIGNFGGGCWSYVGRIPLEYQPQQLNIGYGCLFVDTVEHEMMHALGFFHEQARPDRDEHVTIHWDNIDPEKYINFNKATEINSRGSPYDYESIMHYTSTAFAIDPQSPTISVKDPNLNVVLGSATTMTDIDQHQLRMLYRCETSVRNVVDNCIDTCPCRLNEGNCTSDSQCAETLRCIDSICVDSNTTATAPPPTSQPITSPPTKSPTTTAPSSTKETNTELMIGLGVTVALFGVVLIGNLI
jgi:hypothetical protein